MKPKVQAKKSEFLFTVGTLYSHHILILTISYWRAMEGEKRFEDNSHYHLSKGSKVSLCLFTGAAKAFQEVLYQAGRAPLDGDGI